ncbi:hypothetical protein GAY29_30580, partial [Azospirillum brasilense]|nr:hypothetical protein [Azospirillum brasilense]
MGWTYSSAFPQPLRAAPPFPPPGQDVPTPGPLTTPRTGPTSVKSSTHPTPRECSTLQHPQILRVDGGPSDGSWPMRQVEPKQHSHRCCVKEGHTQ